MLRTLCTVVLLWMSATLAAADGWRVDRVNGSPQYALEGLWVQLSQGIEVPDSSWIRTGDRGRVLLSRGPERILMKPQTLAAIATWQENGLQTQVTQRSGSVSLDVQVRNRQHTRVVTPHLAAVVKGTAFEVTVEITGSAVRVDRGAVEVSARSLHSPVLVMPGETATIAPSLAPGATISSDGAAPRTVTGGESATSSTNSGFGSNAQGSVVEGNNSGLGENRGASGQRGNSKANNGQGVTSRNADRQRGNSRANNSRGVTSRNADGQGVTSRGDDE